MNTYTDTQYPAIASSPDTKQDEKLQNKAPANILIVDDDEAVVAAFVELLKLDGYQSLVARTGEEALEKLSVVKPELIFMDVTMPKLDGLEALKKMKERDISVPVVIITGNGTMHTAINAMKFGAYEYLTKPIDGKTVRQLTRRVLQSTQSRVTLSPNRFQFGMEDGNTYELVGNSQPMQNVFKLIGSIASTPNRTSVLITGESGTGKELAARAIHANSANAREPFVAINCTVLTESLLESELFGHERGAFTGAVDRKIGKFEFAREGTIFLDEIGDISPELQKKLLRVLQERQCERLGGNQSIAVKARFIAATNRNLADEVKKGRFREDLFYRLNVAAVQMPPLRERADDIPLLAEFFLQKYNARMAKSIKGFSDEALRLIQTYTYPGNVRELGNIIERAVMMTKGDVILPELFTELSSSTQIISTTFPIVSQNFGEARDYVVGLFEAQFVTAQLNRVNGNVTLAAKNSGMTRQNFQRLMKKHNIQSEEFRNS